MSKFISPEAREVRSFALDLELRAASGKLPTIRGHAAVFNVLSEDLGGFREMIRPGVFARAIKERHDVRALLNHDSSMVLGRTKAGTLRLAEDRRGLAVEIDPPDNTLGRDVVESIRRRDLDQMSFAFRAAKEFWSVENGEDIREILDADLYDVSPVAYPAYSETDVAVRSHQKFLGSTGREAVCPRLNRRKRQLAILELELNNLL